jgi:hypothetical protein
MRSSTLRKLADGKLRRGNPLRPPKDFIKREVTITDGCGNELTVFVPAGRRRCPRG